METEAKRALDFAKQHDWGRLARVRMNRHGFPYLVNLIDASTKDGLYHEELVSVPATVKAVREFGNY